MFCTSSTLSWQHLNQSNLPVSSVYYLHLYLHENMLRWLNIPSLHNDSSNKAKNIKATILRLHIISNQHPYMMDYIPVSKSYEKRCSEGNYVSTNICSYFSRSITGTKNNGNNKKFFIENILNSAYV